MSETQPRSSYDAVDKWITWWGDPESTTMLLAMAEGRLTPEMIDAPGMPSTTARRKRQLVDFYYASTEEQAETLALAHEFLEQHGLLTDDGFSQADFIPETRVS